MAPNPANARMWTGADVFVSWDLAAALPANANTALPAAWKQLGLLNGVKGFTQSRSSEVKDFIAWGDILFASSDTQYKEEVKFSTHEANEHTDRLKYPGSSTTRIVVPKPEKVLLALEKRNGTRIERLFSAGYAKVRVDGDIESNEENPDERNFVATIYPMIDPADNLAVLWTPQTAPVLTSIAITPLTRAIAVAGITSVTATGTFSDSSTADLTSLVTWASSTPAKATVAPGPVIVGVAAGTTNITCSYQGVSSAAACVVTVS